jgi:rare lipoprotein A (peptidoglycan hydrolase)
MLTRLARHAVVSGRTVRVVCLVGVGLALAACSATEELAPKFSEAEYGKASPRVVAGSKKVPDGGGRYMVGQPYRVAGRTYVPQDNPEGYTATGTASWYGANFHGRKTANGEVYDMGDLTAAHPTLPLPSYVRVTNLANDRSVVVRVNDRGPFSHNRVIDVSAQTAAMLDFKRAGTAKVKVDYIAPAQLDGKDDKMLVASFRGPGEGPAMIGGGNTMVASNERTRRPILAFGAKSRPAIDFSVADETMAFGGEHDSAPALDPLAPLILDSGFVASYAEPDVQVFTRAQAAANAMAQNAAFDGVAVPPPAVIPAPKTVQVGTFSDISNAKRVAGRLASFGEPAIAEDRRDGRTFHVVRVKVVNGAVDPQAVIAAASDLGLAGAFVLRAAE